MDKIFKYLPPQTDGIHKCGNKAGSELKCKGAGRRGGMYICKTAKSEQPEKVKFIERYNILKDRLFHIYPNSNMFIGPNVKIDTFTRLIELTSPDVQAIDFALCQAGLQACKF